MRFAWHRHSPTAQRARAATPRVIFAHRHLEPLLTTLLACLPQVRSVDGCISVYIALQQFCIIDATCVVEGGAWRIRASDQLHSLCSAGG